MVGLIVAAPNIIGFLYHRTDFAQSVQVLQALAPGLAILYLNSVWTTTLMSMKMGKQLPWIAGLALVFNVLGNLVLIPRMGGVGSAIMTSLTELLLMVLALWVLPRNLLPLRSVATGAKALGASLAMALVVVVLSKQSILVILPVAAIVYAVTATALATIPREESGGPLWGICPKSTRCCHSSGCQRSGRDETGRLVHSARIERKRIHV